MSRLVLLVIALALVGGGAYYVSNLAAENAQMRQQLAKLQPPPGAPKAAAPAAPAGPPRTITAEQHQAMVAALRDEAGPEKKIWLRVDPNDAEAAGFEKAIEDVFREAGWEVNRMGSDGLLFKPGIYLLVGEEDWPTYAETANKALEAGGITVTAARGYRSYYEQQTKEKPGWRGAKFLPDETYVVLVGRKPEA
jgi:hypothetical protein